MAKGRLRRTITFTFYVAIFLLCFSSLCRKLLLCAAVFQLAVKIPCGYKFELVREPSPKECPRPHGSAIHTSTSRAARQPIFPNNPEVSHEVELIIDSIVRDFVASWYQSISSDPQSPFLEELKSVLYTVFINLETAVSKVDLPEFAVLKVLPLVTKHFKAFRVAREKVASRLLLKSSPSEGDVSFAVAVEFGRYYRVHPAISLGSEPLGVSLERYSREKALFILQRTLNDAELSSKFVQILGREILCCNVICPMLQRFVNADFWNDTVESVATTILRERTQVKEIRRVLSTQLDAPKFDIERRSLSQLESVDFPMNISIETNSKGFEKFLKCINSESTEQSLRAIKFSVLSQLLNLGQAKKAGKEEQLFKSRLLLSLNLLESRLEYLRKGSSEAPVLLNELASTQIDAFKRFLSSMSIDDVLSDEFCCNVFYEFLKENNKKGECCLKFWMRIDEFKNPLEDPSTDDLAMMSEGDVKGLHDACSDFFSSSNMPVMQTLNEQYAQDISDFCKAQICSNLRTTGELYPAARKSAMRMQALAHEYLQKNCLPNFKASQSFSNMISTDSFHNTRLYTNFVFGSEGGRSRQEYRKFVAFPQQEVNDLDKVKESQDGEDEALHLKVKKSFSDIFGRNEEGVIFESKIFEDESSENENDSSEDYEQSDFSEEGNEISNSRVEISGPSSSMHGNRADLKSSIAELTISIDRLRKQLSLLDHLCLKADLTDSGSQLRLLKKSERSVTKEIYQKELLRQQLIVQENSNSLFRKCQVSIKSHLSDISQDTGKEVVYYIISVSHSNNDVITSWDTPRRYSEFYELNAYLRKRFSGLVKHLQNKDYFPEKIKMSLVYHVSKTFLYKERSVKLERYLRNLLFISEVCQDQHFRRFLTQAGSTFRIKSTSKVNEDRHSLLSRIDSVSSKMCDAKIASTASPNHVKSPELELKLEDEMFKVPGQGGAETDQIKKGNFIKPICDLFITLFSLNHSRSSWLRGRALLIVIQQLLGGTIEKYVKESIERISEKDNILKTVSKLRLTLWPDGVFYKKTQTQERPQKGGDELLASQKDAKAKLEMLLSETCGRVVGIRSSKKAGAEINAMFQNEYLNASFFLEVLDLVFAEAFANFA